MVVVIPPRIAVADAIQFIKTQSAKSSRRNYLLCKKPMQGKAASGREDTVYRV